MKKAAEHPRTIDDYLAPLGTVERKALEKLRRDIHAAAPRAEECIRYGIPGFRLNGKYLAGFGASAKHLSFYPGASVQQFSGELKGYSLGKGTIRFSAETPPPGTLVKRLVRMRISRLREKR